MKKSRVALSILNATGFSLTIEGLEIKSFNEAPDGQEFNLDLSAANKVKKSIASLAYPIECEINAIEDKTPEQLATDIAAIELGESQVIADNIKDSLDKLALTLSEAEKVVEVKQAAFDVADKALNGPSEAELEAKAAADKIAADKIAADKKAADKKAADKKAADKKAADKKADTDKAGDK